MTMKSDLEVIYSIDSMKISATIAIPKKNQNSTRVYAIPIVTSFISDVPGTMRGSDEVQNASLFEYSSM